MQLSSVLRSIVLATVILTTLSACVSTGKHKQAVAERDAALDQRSTIALEKAKLQKAYDELNTLLADEIAANEVRLTQLVDGVEVEIPSDVLFASGATRPSVSDGSRDELIKLAQYLKDADFFITVVGHTDSRQPTARLAKQYPTNWEMGAARAAIAARFLEQQGVDPTRIAAVSRSQHRPVAANDTPDGRARNRRIQIILRTLPEGF